MYSSIKDLPIAIDLPEGTLREISWGYMTVEVGHVKQDFSPEKLSTGITGSRCQCPHWGYVIKGRMRLRYPDHEEVYQAGDVYYALPSHMTFYEEGCEYVEFSPTMELNKAKEAAKEASQELMEAQK